MLEITPQTHHEYCAHCLICLLLIIQTYSELNAWVLFGNWDGKVSWYEVHITKMFWSTQKALMTYMEVDTPHDKYMKHHRG